MKGENSNVSQHELKKIQLVFTGMGVACLAFLQMLTGCGGQGITKQKSL